MNQIQIIIKPEIERFVRFVFKNPKGEINVDTRHPIGKMIISQVQRNIEIPKPYQKTSIILNLPCNGITKNPGCFSITADGIEQIELFVKAYEYVYFTHMIGQLIKKGFSNLKAVEAYLLMIDSEKNTDTITKQQYRKRKKMMNWYRYFLHKIHEDINELADLDLV